jgi:hypothetical protein
MNAKQNRARNLQRLLNEFDGDLTKLANASDTSYDNLWQILNGTLLPSGKPRGVGDELAAKLERGSKKPPGWMDQNHELSQEAMNIAELFSKLPETRQRELAPIIRAAIGPHISDGEVEEKMPITNSATARK